MSKETVSSQTVEWEKLLEQMIAARQLSPIDAELLRDQIRSGRVQIGSEEDVLRWLAAEYGLEFRPWREWNRNGRSWIGSLLGF